MIQNNQLSENQMAESFFSIQDLLKMLAKRKAKNESSERVVRINLSSLHNIHAVSRNRLLSFIKSGGDLITAKFGLSFTWLILI